MEYLLVAIIWVIPIGWFLLSTHLINRRVREIAGGFTEADSQLFENLKVHFKNYDVFKKKKPFHSLSLYEPIYQFHTCDLRINQRGILMIGKPKEKFFVKLQRLNVSVISYNHKVEDQMKHGFVKLVDITLTKKYVEIEFRDRKYEKSITAMVSIDGNEELREAIKSWLRQSEANPSDLTGKS